MADEWNSLDSAAKANLGDDGTDSFNRFIVYRDKLKSEGHEWADDACDILTGFIWDEIELNNRD